MRSERAVINIKLSSRNRKKVAEIVGEKTVLLSWLVCPFERSFGGV